LRKPSANAPAAEPVADAELEDVFASFAGLTKIALAVSGGPDSLALLHLALAWRGRLAAGRPEFLVLTVDHGLRPEGRAEAEAVAKAATSLGVPAKILTRPAPATSTAIQADARADRYRLLKAATLESGAQALATGHTLDDQAETLLMRLARGSGVDGLAAMAPVSQLGELRLLRPLLGLPKARLEASLRTRSIAWITDPSNANPAFERPRLRAIMPALEAAGLTAHAIATSARRLARGRAALEQITGEAARRIVIIHDEGYFDIARADFDALPQDIRLRLLGRLIARLGTPEQPERLARLERLVTELERESHPAASLAGCLIKAGPDRITLIREPGREGLPVLTLAPGASADWDRRCHIAVAASAPGGLTIRALTEADVHEHIAAAARASGLPRAVLLTCPSAWRGPDLIAMPVLGFLSADVAFTPGLSLGLVPDRPEPP